MCRPDKLRFRRPYKHPLDAPLQASRGQPHALIHQQRFQETGFASTGVCKALACLTSFRFLPFSFCCVYIYIESLQVQLQRPMQIFGSTKCCDMCCACIHPPNALPPDPTNMSVEMCTIVGSRWNELINTPITPSRPNMHVQKGQCSSKGACSDGS